MFVPREDHTADCQGWIRAHTPPKKPAVGAGDLTGITLAVLRTHESKVVRARLIASLSFPWRFSKGDSDLGGHRRMAPACCDSWRAAPVL